MVREVKEVRLIPVYDDDVLVGYKRIVNIACNHDDEKPTTGLANGSMCIEVDTGKLFLFDEEEEEWVEFGGSSDSGSGGGDEPDPK